MTRDEFIDEVGIVILRECDEALPGVEVFGVDDSEDARLDVIAEAFPNTSISELVSAMMGGIAERGGLDA